MARVVIQVPLEWLVRLRWITDPSVKRVLHVDRRFTSRVMTASLDLRLERTIKRLVNRQWLVWLLALLTLLLQIIEQGLLLWLIRVRDLARAIT